MGVLLLTVLSGASLVGVNMRLEDVADIPQVAEAGFDAVRTDLSWNAVEPERGRYDFTAFDAFVDALSANRLRPVLILDYGSPHYDGGEAPRSDEARAAFARYAGLAARRYAGRGVVWEIWNEPNLPGYWRPRPDAAAYVALVAAAAAQIHAADPSATVAGLSLGGCEWDRPYLRAAIAAGLLAHLDAVSLHLYPAPSADAVPAFLDELRGLMREAGRELPILCTEMGVLTHDESRQWDYFVRMTEAARRGGAPLVVWYSWKDDEEGHFGVVDRRGHRKLSWYLPRLLPAAGPALAPAGTGSPAGAGSPSREDQCRAPASDGPTRAEAH